MELERVETAEQIRAVAVLARATWTAHYVPIIGREQVEYMLERFQSEGAIGRQIAEEGYEYYVARAAGYLAVVPDGAGTGLMLSKLYVAEGRRRTGLGRAMVTLAEERCRALDRRELWLTVNKHNLGSIAFYERMGFERTGALVTDIGGGFVMDDWRMAKKVGH